MNAFNKYKNRLEQFLQTERGKRFINFTYSIGAAIVLLGVMFKLLHFPFGNQMLFIGIMTEVIVFVLSAFDTPIRDYRWERVFPSLSSGSPKDTAGFNDGIVEQATATLEGRQSPVTGPQNYEIPHHLSSHTEEYGKQMENLNRTLSGLNAIYEIQLKSISGQMGTIEEINRGLSRLKSVYGDSLPDGAAIQSETEKMAHQLKELNDVYARMLQAMTVNKPDKPDSSNT